MANIIKPVDINKIWSASGDILAPSDSKISQGWGVEIPPRQYFNYIDHKQDQFNAHVNQHGIPVWDALTEYQANTSYTQATDGNVYIALQTHVGQNPLTSVGFWAIAFVTYSSLGGANVSFATNGFIKEPSGKLEVWGQFTTNSATQSAQITFPTAFLEPPYSITGAHQGNGGAIFVEKGNTKTATGFVAILSTALESTGTGSYVGSYRAIGRWK